MPLPIPNENESRDVFESRCMSDDTMTTEYANPDQRYAICVKQWESRSDQD